MLSQNCSQELGEEVSVDQTGNFGPFDRGKESPHQIAVVAASRLSSTVGLA